MSISIIRDYFLNNNFLIILFFIIKSNIIVSLGPVFDIHYNKFLISNNFMSIIYKSVMKLFKFNLELFILCIYDAVLVIYLNVSFQHGLVVKNNFINYRSLLNNLLFNISYLMVLSYAVSIIKVFYNVEIFQFLFNEQEHIKFNYLIVGFSSIFLLSKFYFSILVSEICQLKYYGIFRSICLGSTEGLNILFIKVKIIYQFLIAPCKIIVLGRIFNVTGSILDRFIEQVYLCCFSLFPLSDLSIISNISKTESYSVEYAVN